MEKMSRREEIHNHRLRIHVYYSDRVQKLTKMSLPIVAYRLQLQNYEMIVHMGLLALSFVQRAKVSYKYNDYVAELTVSGRGSFCWTDEVYTL